MIVNPVQYDLGTKLPELTNPGSAADLLAGKQLVDQYGNPLTGTMPQKSASDLTASGATVSVPAGYYPSQVSKSVATATHPKPTLSRSGGTITATHTQSAGYTSGGTTTGTLSITTQAGKTVTPTTSRQTAVASGRLTTGAVYVEGDANLKAENIKSGVSIFGVNGKYSNVVQSNITVSSATDTLTFTLPSDFVATCTRLSSLVLDGGDKTTPISSTQFLAIIAPTLGWGPSTGGTYSMLTNAFRRPDNSHMYGIAATYYSWVNNIFKIWVNNLIFLGSYYYCITGY